MLKLCYGIVCLQKELGEGSGIELRGQPIVVHAYALDILLQGPRRIQDLMRLTEKLNGIHNSFYGKVQEETDEIPDRRWVGPLEGPTIPHF